MRAFGFVSLLLTLGIIGYLMMKQQEPGNNEGTNPATARVVEDAAMRAAKTAALTEVKAAINTYRTSHEKWPVDLNALVDDGQLNRVPSGVQYDPQTGEVTVAAPQP